MSRSASRSAGSLLFVSALALGIALAAPAAAQESERSTNNPREQQNDPRTSNRTPSGELIYPAWLFATPEHYEFLPHTSNHDPQHSHPQQWKGQDWDPSAWNSRQWTPEIALQKLFEGKVFHRQYNRKSFFGNIPGSSGTPVLEVGPNFYKLSDLDRRRSLKLLADHTGVFENGHTMIQLRDWHTRKVVGNYTEKGMHLD